MNEQRINTKIVVLYHGNCPDGFGGAYAAWKFFGKRATYIPLFRSNHPIEIEGKEVYMIDFMYRPDPTAKLIKNNIKVVAIDHHVSALDSVKLTKEHLYSNEHSGAALAWKYFHGSRKMPRLLKYVEDYDLWKFKVPKTREVSAMLDLFPFDFKAWDKFAGELENTSKRKQIEKNGALLLKYQKKLVESLLPEAEEVQFSGFRAYALNVSIFKSEIASELVKRLPPLAIIWSESRGKIVVSLRSNGKADVSKIAEKFGGGGHKAAAGFILEKGDKIPWVQVK